MKPNSLSHVPLTREEAREITDEIRDNIFTLRSLLLRFYRGKGWEALGYDSIKHWADGEFNLSYQQVYKVIRAATYDDEVHHLAGIEIEMPVSHADELAQLEDASDRITAYENALQDATTQGKEKPTTADVSRAVKAMKKRRAVSSSGHHVVANLLAADILSGDEAIKIVKILDEVGSQVAHFIQALMVEHGLKNVPLIERIALKKKRELDGVDEPSEVIHEVTSSGALNGTPLSEAGVTDWELAGYYQAREKTSRLPGVSVVVFPDDMAKTLQNLRVSLGESFSALVSHLRKTADE